MGVGGYLMALAAVQGWLVAVDWYRLLAFVPKGITLSAHDLAWCTRGRRDCLCYR